MEIIGAKWKKKGGKGGWEGFLEWDGSEGAEKGEVVLEGRRERGVRVLWNKIKGIKIMDIEGGNLNSKKSLVKG